MSVSQCAQPESSLRFRLGGDLRRDVCCAGRVHTISVVKCVGALLLIWMGLWPGMWRRKALVIVVYLLRTMANNSTYALQKSILMDFVSKVLAYFLSLPL